MRRDEQVSSLRKMARQRIARMFSSIMCLRVIVCGVCVCVCLSVCVCCLGQSEDHLHPVLTMSDSVMMSFSPIWSQTDCPSEETLCVDSPSNVTCSTQRVQSNNEDKATQCGSILASVMLLKRNYNKYSNLFHSLSALTQSVNREG